MINVLLSATLETVLIGLAVTTAHCALSILALVWLIRSRMELHKTLVWIFLATFLPFIGPCIGIWVAVSTGKQSPDKSSIAVNAPITQSEIEDKRRRVAEAEAELSRAHEELRSAQARDSEISS